MPPTHQQWGYYNYNGSPTWGVFTEHGFGIPVSGGNIPYPAYPSQGVYLGGSPHPNADSNPPPNTPPPPPPPHPVNSAETWFPPVFGTRRLEDLPVHTYISRYDNPGSQARPSNRLYTPPPPPTPEAPPSQPPPTNQNAASPASNGYPPGMLPGQLPAGWSNQGHFPDPRANIWPEDAPPPRPSRFGAPRHMDPDYLETMD